MKDTERMAVCIEILYVQALLLGNFSLQNNEAKVLNKRMSDLIRWGIKDSTVGELEDR